MKKRLLVLSFSALAFMLLVSEVWAGNGGAIKWSQPPDMEFGVNIQSTEPEPIVGDDWRCEDPRPVTDVHFWGSYIGWERGRPLPVPTPDPPGVRGFKIRIYRDVPAGVDPGMPWSHPGEPVYEADIENFEERFVASIPHPDELFEHKFYYHLDLPRPFEQREGTIYWISISAIMPAESQFPWGWETSRTHWNDNAVTGDGVKWRDFGSPVRPLIDFEDLPLNADYHVPDTFVSSSIPITLKRFQWTGGGWTDGGHARVISDGAAGGSGNEININNVNLEFDFWLPLTTLSLLFGEYGGNLNIEINGHFENFENFDEINGLIIGGVEVSVVNGHGNDTGILNLSGRIAQFAIGGQELVIDDVNLNRRIDMAFELSVPYEPPPPLEPVKWQQRPDMVNGVNIKSDPAQQATVADDWLCLGGSPVSDLHFWGSYPGWMESEREPGPNTPGIEAFRIQVYSDDPATAMSHSRPDKLLYQVWVKDFDESFVKSIFQPWREGYEHKYRYDLDLPRIFWQKRDRIYWLNISAIPRQDRPWGWESSMDRWNDAAVQGWYDDPSSWRWDPIWHPLTGQFIDMSFELTTCEGPIKWLQFPDMANGFNIVSPDVNGLVVADDWLCTNGRPVTEVHFWGSYLNRAGAHWEQGNPGPPDGPLPRTPGVQEFLLSFHRDVPAGADPDMPWSHPGERIHGVSVDEFIERYWDSVPHVGPEDTIWWEHKFIYIIRLEGENRFRQEEGQVYWLDIGARTPHPEDWSWGWETSKDHWNDNAVTGDGRIWRDLGMPLADFEDLPVGAAYHVGDIITTMGVNQIMVRDFQWNTGTWTDKGVASVGNAGLAGGSGHEISVNNVNLDFRLDVPVTGLSLLFGEYGGNLNISVNSNFRNFENFADIDGLTIGGVHIKVVNGAGNDMGSLHLTGMISQFFIGGQELLIDEVKRHKIDMAFLLMTEDDTPYCRCDFDRNGRVDNNDLSVFAQDFGRTDCYWTGNCEGDLDYHGSVDGLNLAVLADELRRNDCPCAILPVTTNLE